MKTARALLFCVLLFCTFSLAQTRSRTGASTVSTLSGGINLRTVEGAPFSADLVRESTQVSTDGTPVTRETHGKMFRDSLGRTRSETELESAVAGGASKQYVTIVDPKQQTSTVLDVAAKTATIYHLPAAPAVSGRSLKMVAAAQNSAVSGSRHPGTAGAESLGTMTIEGFLVTGSRRAHANEATVAKGGPQGAEIETWFSPELKVELQTTTRLSPTVSQTTRLTKIASGEPDPLLFQVPAGYTVQDNSQPK
jgi:hypothetical protein